jgi:hypothetical protein
MSTNKNKNSEANSEAADNAARLATMETVKAAADKAAADKAAAIADKARVARAAADKAAADKAAAVAIAAADKAAADKAAAAAGDAIAAATAVSISAEFDALNGGVARMALMIQTVLGACNGNIQRAAAIVGRERKRLVADRIESAILSAPEGADIGKVESATHALHAVPIASFVLAAKAAGLTRKSCQDFANGTDLVSRQSVSRAVIAAFADDDKPKPEAAVKTIGERILAILAKDGATVTAAEAAAITAAIAAAIAEEVESED